MLVYHTSQHGMPLPFRLRCGVNESGKATKYPSLQCILLRASRALVSKATSYKSEASHPPNNGSYGDKGHRESPRGLQQTGVVYEARQV